MKQLPDSEDGKLPAVWFRIPEPYSRYWTPVTVQISVKQRAHHIEGRRRPRPPKFQENEGRNGKEGKEGIGIYTTKAVYSWVKHTR